VPAADGIFAAFQSHSIVGMADWHGLAQEEDFYVDLIRDPRFTEVAGEDIPYEQLRRVWTDTVGWLPTVTTLGYLNFFAQVRAVNEGLPLSERIHIWLGEPPFDWSKIKTPPDLAPQRSQRNRYPAELIRSQILAKHRKALVIYGSFHFFGLEAQKPLVEQSYPGAFFVVTPYMGSQNIKITLTDRFTGKIPQRSAAWLGTSQMENAETPGHAFGVDERKAVVVFWGAASPTINLCELEKAQSAKPSDAWAAYKRAKNGV
jgi:hypothetical protein